MTKNDRKALFDPQTSRVGIDLIEISTDGMPTICLCRNTEAVVSRGNAYLPAVMEIEKPAKGTDVANASFRLSGVNLDHIELVQNLPPDSIVTIMNAFIFTDNPDEYIDGPYFFTLEGISIDSSTGTIDMQLSVENPLDYNASQTRYESEGFPAIWI